VRKKLSELPEQEKYAGIKLLKATYFQKNPRPANAIYAFMD